MLLESCTERGDSSVQEAGEDVHGSGQVTFQESCRSTMQSQLQPPRSRSAAWSKCLSVRQYTDVVSLWGVGVGRGGGIKTYDCKGNRTNSNNRSMWWP